MILYQSEKLITEKHSHLNKVTLDYSCLHKSLPAISYNINLINDGPVTLIIDSQDKKDKTLIVDFNLLPGTINIY